MGAFSHYTKEESRMNIITISREFGSGGRELGKRMADILGYDYYDKQIISAISERCGMNQGYVEQALAHHGWQTVPLTYRHSFAASTAMQSIKVSLLLEERRVIEQIAAAGKSCIIVGRNADVLLSEHRPFNLFVCAEMQARIARCMKHAEADEKMAEKQMERSIRALDKSRAQSRALLTDCAWGQRDAYHLTVNTTGWEIKALAPLIADYALRYFEQQNGTT